MTSSFPRPMGIGSLTLCAALAIACGGGDSGTRDGEVHASGAWDYVPPTPRPLPRLHAVPLDDARFRVTAADVRYAKNGLHVRARRVDTRLDAAGAQAIDLAGVAAERSDDGALVWRIRADQLRLRDLALIEAPRAGTLLPARLTVEAGGMPLRRVTVSGRATADRDGVVRTHVDARSGGSRIAVDAVLPGNGDWRARTRLDPLLLADARVFSDAIPATGTAHGVVVLGGANDVLRASTDGLSLRTDSSRVDVRGAVVRAGSSWTFDDVVVELARVAPGDFRAWFGADPPLDAPLRGRIEADGSGRSGVALRGSVRSEDAAGSRLAADVEGTLRLEPSLRFDLRLESRALDLAGSGPLDLDLAVSGTPDSIALAGAARLSPERDTTHPLLARVPDAAADLLSGGRVVVDADVLRADGGRRARGRVDVVDHAGRVRLTVGGHAPLAHSGPLDVVARADSLPLSMLPPHPAIEDLEGWLRMDTRVQGSLDTPSVRAHAELIGARFRVPEYGTSLDSMTLVVALEGDRIALADARAWRGDGALALRGGVDLAGPLDLRAPRAALDGATIDVAVTMDTMTVVDTDSLRAVTTGRLAVSGPLRRPHVAGAVEIVDGFAFEGRLAPDPPIDPEDPPDADLLARVPWPDTPLRARARAEETGDAAAKTLPLTADVRVGVHPAFRVIDEDSDLGASGDIHIVVDGRGARASGQAAIVDGFYAYYGELFQLVGGAFSLSEGSTRLAMAGSLRGSGEPLGSGLGGTDGLERRDPPIGIFGYSTPATVLELLERRSPLPATQADLASMLLFGVPIQPIDTWEHELTWRGDEPDDLVGHRSAIQGAGLAWSWVADELYDYVPIDRGYLRAGTVLIGSSYPGWVMLGTRLEAGAHVGPRLTLRGTHVVGGETLPGLSLRWALRDRPVDPADRHVELFNEPRFSTGLGTAGTRDDFRVRRRTGARVRWLWDW